MIVCGLGLGDEGKGTIVDHLVRRLGARVVVRWNGGPQAGHNVVTDDGRWHCFAQLGAGSFAGARSVLGPGMLVELEALVAERAALAGKGCAPGVTIDPDCTVITPMHKLVNQLGELAAPRGSCGMGVGEAVKWRERELVVRVGDLVLGTAGAGLERLADTAFAAADALLGERPSAERLELYRYFRERCDPHALHDRYRAIAETLDLQPVRDALAGDAAVVFEGAQGALLDRTRGFAPFVTQSRTTPEDARASRAGLPCTGVLRAHAHRHGRGPLVTEDAALAARFADPYNRENRWQGPFRTGPIDLVALRYGVELVRPDQLALTSLDRLAGLAELRLCTSYEYRGELAELADLVEHTPLALDRTRITALRTPATPADARRLTAVLARCRPLDWLVLDGFAGELANARSLADLPAQARRFVDTVEHELGVPVAIVSVRPDAAGKLAVSA